MRALYAVHAERYRELHHVLLDAFAAATGLLESEGSEAFRKRSSPEWRQLSREAARLLRRSRRRGYLRWIRILQTEPNLVDLAVNEAERKAGVRIRVTPALRRHPLLLGWREFLRVLRERNTRERIERKPGAAPRPPGPEGARRAFCDRTRAREAARNRQPRAVSVSPQPARGTR